MKIIPALTGPMSGKLGGMVASRNRGGQYFRRKAAPVNPDTSLQSARRSAFASLISAWNNTLTDAQRATWTQWAANTPRLDSLGQTHVLTGQNAFVGYNTLLLQADGSFNTDNSGQFNRGSSPTPVEFVSTSPTAYALNVTFDMPTDEDGFLLTYIGRPQNVTRNFFKGPYRFFKSQQVNSPASTAVVAITSLSTLPFPVTVGQLLPVYCVMVYADGRYTDKFRGSFVVPAPTP